MARLTWLWKLEDALLHVLGPAQLSDPAEDARRDEARSAAPAPPPRTLIPGGWVRRGAPGSYYIVRADQADAS
jgi:hypothetical protein